MKKFMQLLKDWVNQFFGNTPPPPSEEEEKKAAIKTILAQAVATKSAVHVIYQHKSFTGDILKYKEETQQLFLRNFAKTITTVIALPDIQRVTLVPESVKQSQKTHL